MVHDDATSPARLSVCLIDRRPVQLQMHPTINRRSPPPPLPRQRCLLKWSADSGEQNSRNCASSDAQHSADVREHRPLMAATAESNYRCPDLTTQGRRAKQIHAVATASLSSIKQETHCCRKKHAVVRSLDDGRTS